MLLMLHFIACPIAYANLPYAGFDSDNQVARGDGLAAPRALLALLHLLALLLGLAIDQVGFAQPYDILMKKRPAALGLFIAFPFQVSSIIRSRPKTGQELTSV